MRSELIIRIGAVAVGGLLTTIGVRDARADDPYSTESQKPYFEQVALSLGGGVEGFTDEEMTDRTDPAGAWGIRAQFGTRSALSLEVAYLGSAQDINTLGLGPNALLIGNGAEADARFNLTDQRLQPYVFLGLAWRRYNVTNSDSNFSDVADADDVGEIPMGVGLAYRMNQFVIDARGQVRPAFDNDLVSANRAGADLHRWNVSANLGYEF